MTADEWDERSETILRYKKQIKKLEEFLRRLKNSECWCDHGVGHPLYSAHTSLCKEIQSYFKEKKK